MKKIRERFGRWYFIIPLAAIFTFVSCNKGATTVTPIAKFSGIEIFKAIYFGSGKAAENIKDYAGKINNLAVSSMDRQSLDSAENEIVTLVLNKDKNFFNDFASKIRSGVPATVREALMSSNAIIKKAIEEKFQVSFNQEKVTALVNELKKDRPLNPADYKKAFTAKKQKYSSLITYSLTIKPMAEAPPEENTNTVKVQNFAFLYFYLVVAVAAVLVLFVSLPAAVDPNDATNANNGTTDLLSSEQTIAAITSGFSE